MKFYCSVVFLVMLLKQSRGLYVSKRLDSEIDIGKILENGPVPVAEASYEYPIVNDIELTPSSNNLTTQIRGHIYFPNATMNNINRPFPILVFLPGKHPDCRLPVTPGYPALDFGATDNLGRCPHGLLTVPSHLGFAYLGQYFASHSYIVISIDVVLINNKWGIPGDDTLNFVRARIVLRTLQKMMELNRNAETSKLVLDGVDLSGKFDFTQIGMVGHSRGGEGVRNAYNMLMENKGPSDASKWRERLPGVTIRAIMEIAPMYYGQNGTKLGVENIPWGMIVSGCEDDETDYAHLYLAYEQMKIAKRPNYILHVYGANHEFFNTEWQFGLSMCFGDQEPLWDIHAPSFNLSDLYPPAANTSIDVTLLKINGSESQRRAAIFSLSSFFRAYVGVDANPSFAKLLEPSTPLPANVTEIGRQFFDNNQSIQLYNGSGNITGTVSTKITPLRQYAQSMFASFATAYDSSPVPPPHFSYNPPQKGNLSLGCLEHIENAVYIDFDNQTQSEIIVLFNKIEGVKVTNIDIQLARRSSCWFMSTHPSTCAEPREMKIDIQLQTQQGSVATTTVSLKSRYNLQFARCDAMDYPPEKIGFLPVMFETIRVPVADDLYVSGLKFISQYGGSMILGSIAASVQQSSTASVTSMPLCVLYNLLFIFFALYFLITF